LWDRSAPRIKDSAPLGIQEKERPHRYEADRFIHREILWVSQVRCHTRDPGARLAGWLKNKIVLFHFPCPAQAAGTSRCPGNTWEIWLLLLNDLYQIEAVLHHYYGEKYNCSIDQELEPDR